MGKENEYVEAIETATAYVDKQGWVDGLKARYGKDKTFAVPDFNQRSTSRPRILVGSRLTPV